MSDPESAGGAQEVKEKHDDAGKEFDTSRAITSPLFYDAEQEQEQQEQKQEQESVGSSSQSKEPIADIGETSGANLPAVDPAQNYESVGSQRPEVQDPPPPKMEPPEDTLDLPPGSSNPIPSTEPKKMDPNAPEWGLGDAFGTYNTVERNYTNAPAGLELQHEERHHGDMSMAAPYNINADLEQEQQQKVEAANAEIMKEVIGESAKKDDRGKAPVAEELPVSYGSDPLEAAATAGETMREVLSRESARKEDKGKAPIVEDDEPPNPYAYRTSTYTPLHMQRELMPSMDASPRPRRQAPGLPPLAEESTSAAPSRWRGPHCFPCFHGQSTSTMMATDEASTSTSASRASTSRWRGPHCFPCFHGQSTNTMTADEASTSTSAPRASTSRWRLNFFPRTRGFIKGWWWKFRRDRVPSKRFGI